MSDMTESQNPEIPPKTESQEAKTTKKSDVQDEILKRLDADREAKKKEGETAQKTLEQAKTQLKTAEEAYNSAKEQWEKAKDAVKSAENTAESAKEAEKQYSDLADEFQKGFIIRFYTKLPEIYPDLNSNIEKSIEKFFRRFPGGFEKACISAGIPFDKDSRHPNYKFANDFIAVNISEKNKNAKIAVYEGKTETLSTADIPLIIEKVQTEMNRLFERPYDGQAFLKKVYESYQRLKAKKQDGDTIPIRKIFGNMKTDEFVVDLSRLVKQGPFEIDGRKLELQQTKDTKDGLILHGAERRGAVGYISFKKIRSENAGDKDSSQTKNTGDCLECSSANGIGSTEKKEEPAETKTTGGELFDGSKELPGANRSILIKREEKDDDRQKNCDSGN
ncbi:MAG: hypothetical protein LBG87_06490 [Spirochaetaceae bacterium]|jgi:hypothetical protein|nr:hypothetical protein [Spirochaetaceae bacterium]